MNTNAIPAQQPVRGSCPKCGSERWADVRGHHTESWEDGSAPVWAQTDYRILKCRGCEEIYFQTDAIFSEDYSDNYDPQTGERVIEYEHNIKYWPPPSKRTTPSWSDELHAHDTVLASLFKDIYVALNSDLGVLAAIGFGLCSTEHPRASALILGVDSQKSSVN